MAKRSCFFLMIFVYFILQSCEKIKDSKYEGNWDFSIEKQIHQKIGSSTLDTTYYSTYSGFIRSEKYEEFTGGEERGLRLQYSPDSYIYIQVDRNGNISKTSYSWDVLDHVSITGNFSENNKSLTCTRYSWGIVNSHVNSTTTTISGKKH